MGYDHDTLTLLNDTSDLEKQVKQIEKREREKNLQSRLTIALEYLKRIEEVIPQIPSDGSRYYERDYQTAFNQVTAIAKEARIKAGEKE